MLYYYALCKNLLTDELFRKEFESPYLLRKFIRKCSFSKRVKVLYSNCPF